MIRPNASWDLPQPERVDLNRPTISWSEAAKFTEERFKALEKISQALRQEEEPFIKQERTFLEDSIKFLETFSKANDEFIRQEEGNIRRIKDEIEKHRPEKEKNDNIIAEMKKAVEEIQNQMNTANTQQRDLSLQRKALIDAIDPLELKKIKFKDFQDTSNDVFIWCLQCLYKEPKSSYEWKNFKKQVFKTDKGKDFILRLRGLNLQKLRKDDFVFTKNIIERKSAILQDLEPKGKQNASLRKLLDYMEIVSKVGIYQEEEANDKTLLEEKTKELEKKTADVSKTSNIVKVLEQKIVDSNYFIENLSKLKPSLSNVINMCRERIQLQEQYLSTAKGNLQAVDTFVPSPQKTLQQTPTGGESLQESRTGQVQTQNSPHGLAQSQQEGVKQSQYRPLTQGKDDHEKAEEEETFGGEQAVSGPKSKKVESRNAPTTDLKESEFASSKKGSCESCGMF